MAISMILIAVLVSLLMLQRISGLIGDMAGANLGLAEVALCGYYLE